MCLQSARPSPAQLCLRLIRAPAAGRELGVGSGKQGDVWPVEGSRQLREELRTQLRLVRAPTYLAVDTVGPDAMLCTLKALASVGPRSTPPRFVPVTFAAPPVRGVSGGRTARRGIRFFVAPDSAAPDAEPLSDWLATAVRLRAAKLTDPWRLAHAISLERKACLPMEPVVLEAPCSRRHAQVLSHALAQAQRLAFRKDDDERMLSCTAQLHWFGSPTADEMAAIHVASRHLHGAHAPDEASMGCRATAAIESCTKSTSTDNVAMKIPRLLRVFVWAPDAVV